VQSAGDVVARYELWLDTSVLVSLYVPEARCRRSRRRIGDVPKAEVHVLEAGHFALDTAADNVSDLVRLFLSSKD